MKTCKHSGCKSIATFGNQCQPCRNYRQKYGLTRPQVIQLLDSQLNSCSICTRPISLGRYKGVVDHCHSTSKVRGVLCHECNIMVGYIENSKLSLERLQDYLS
jgi:hypothetical protein